MHSAKKLLNSRSIDYRSNSINKSIDYRTIVSTQEADKIIEAALDLISDQKFKPFFFKTLYIIGPSNFYESMDYARKQSVECRPCIFVKRLKEYRDRVGQN